MHHLVVGTIVTTNVADSLELLAQNNFTEVKECRRYMVSPKQNTNRLDFAPWVATSIVQCTICSHANLPS